MQQPRLLMRDHPIRASPQSAIDIDEPHFVNALLWLTAAHLGRDRVARSAIGDVKMSCAL